MRTEQAHMDAAVMIDLITLETEVVATAFRFWIVPYVWETTMVFEELAFALEGRPSINQLMLGGTE